MIYIVAVLVTFVVTLAIAPVLIKMLKRIKIGQPILSYVEQHSTKSGTPTMGGIIFILPTTVVAFLLGAYKSRIATLIILTVLSYMIVGFLDDFIKVHYKSNQGLKAYQKIISQLLIAVFVTLASYFSISVGTEVYIPFLGKTVDFGWVYIPFTVFIYIATTNAVNLTDGLDGLATSSSLVYFIVFGIIVWGMVINSTDNGDVLFYNGYHYTLIVVSALIGGLLAFLIFNTNRASVFMGDTGSLALGGGVASIAVNTKLSLLIPIIGGVFVWSVVSVIIQVAVFKIKKKRVFLMSPFHHHLELKGLGETKIATIYAVTTALLGLVAIAIIGGNYGFYG